MQGFGFKSFPKPKIRKNSFCNIRLSHQVGRRDIQTLGGFSRNPTYRLQPVVVEFGFLGAMMINVIFPHLVATIALKKYAPGLISGLLLILPINGVILYRALDENIVNLIEVVVSTLIIGAILLISLPLLFRIGKIIKEYNPA